VLGVVARTERHVYLLLAELVERAARQLNERRAMTGRWESAPLRLAQRAVHSRVVERGTRI
jgi:hypothetical protein